MRSVYSVQEFSTWLFSFAAKKLTGGTPWRRMRKADRSSRLTRPNSLPISPLHSHPSQAGPFSVVIKGGRNG